MKTLQTFWVFDYMPWGTTRPAKIWYSDGRVFVPLIFGVWIRTRSVGRGIR